VLRGVSDARVLPPLPGKGGAGEVPLPLPPSITRTAPASQPKAASQPLSGDLPPPPPQ